MVLLPKQVFKNIINYCDDRAYQRHRKIMKKIILDIDLFYDLISNIVRDKVIWWNGAGGDIVSYEDYIRIWMNDRAGLEYIIENHDYWTGRYNYDFNRINRIFFDYEENDNGTITYRWRRDFL